MTAREVVMCTKKISERLRDEFMLTAKIHGCEIKGQEDSAIKVGFTKEQEEQAEKAALEIEENFRKRRENLNG